MSEALHTGTGPGGAGDSGWDSSGLRARVQQARYEAVPVEQIHPNPRQPRKFFDQEALRALATSLRQIGLLEDIMVRPVESGGYEVVLGERRWRASQLAGFDRIPAKIVPLTDEDTLHIALIENLQRENLTAVEEAFAFKRYVDSGKLQKDVGASLGGLQNRVADRLKVLSSHFYIQYQEQRVEDLTAENERLKRDLAAARPTDFEVRRVDEESLAAGVAEGFEVVTQLSGGRFLIRRPRWTSA